MFSVEWKKTSGLTPYDEAIHKMEERVNSINNSTSPGLVWLVEHPSIYTAGTSSKTQDFLGTIDLPIYKTGRGGQYTYHGPGQRIVYVMINLNEYGRDVRAYVHNLQQWIITSLYAFGVSAEQKKNRVGVWINQPDGREDKIAAVGVRVRHWITYHGISINVSPNLSYYQGIVSCGINDRKFGVTSLRDLGVNITMDELDQSLRENFTRVFSTKDKNIKVTQDNMN
ncbi:MAG: Octanoyltransferase [Alphaproteobacteria bacterium MarineAlpha12_Bin1]|nr:MAG: Octanoyltransferase [Alphaproteobacteria bacterium MarineAlpha12_Bin1]|tara:strand:- start:4041 stop:4718 length:678 start_codon:yes stop_codon:yes gene_type:complete